jgi:hypothetical protein
MPKRTLQMSFIVLSLATGLACSDDAGDSIDSGPSDDDAGRMLTAEEAVAALATAVCTRLSECSAVVLECEHGDAAGCQLAHERYSRSVLAAPGAATSPEQLAGCATALESLDCLALVNDRWPEACDFRGSRIDIFGTVADTECPSLQCAAAACGMPEQCETGACGALTSGCGLCITGEPGESCSSPLNCRRGLRCFNTGDGGVCGQYGLEGEACAGDGARCGLGLRCVEGTCVPAGGIGAPCEPASAADCDLLKGLACGADGTCELAAAPSCFDFMQRGDETEWATSCGW